MPELVPPIPRDQFPIGDHTIYLNHAALAPLPRAGYEAARRADEAWMTQGSGGWPHHEERAEAIRADAARLLGASPEELAFVKNTTEGLAFVAEGLIWEEGDRVVIPDHEYPSTLFPFLALERRGVEVIRVPPVGAHGELPLEAFEAAIAGGRTRLVVLSWVQFGTGWRTDLAALAALAHDHGALLVADIIQGAGAVPCDLARWGVDFAAADAHKWLLGPQAVGVLYVHAEHLGSLRVLEPGWNSVVTRDDSDALDLDLDPTARRFEGGTMNLTGIMAFGAGLDLLLEPGVDAVWRHVDGLCQHAADALEDAGARLVTSRHPEHRAGLLTFRVDGYDGAELQERLAQHGITARARVGGVRISPHGWNTAADVDAVVDVVRTLR